MSNVRIGQSETANASQQRTAPSDVQNEVAAQLDIQPAAQTVEAAERRKDALYRLTDRLHHATSFVAIYDAALDAILGALPCNRASILLFDIVGVMRFVASRNLSERYRTLVEGHSPWRPNETLPVPVCIADAGRADLSLELAAAIRNEGIGALGFFPLITGPRLIGKFMAYWDSPHDISAEEVELCLTIARQLAVAIERRRAEEYLRASEQRLRTELADTLLLQRISAELIDQEDVRALYEKIIDAAMAVMHSACASMQMLFPERGTGGELQLLAFRGFHPQAAAFWEWVRADSESTCGAALRSGERVVVTDVSRCDFMAGSADLETYLRTGIRAVQSTPLFSRSGKLVGMISTHWREPHSPSERDLRLLDILARQAADLIERRRANDELTSVKDRLASEVDDLRRLHDFSARSMQQAEVATLLRDLLAAAIEVMHTDKGSVQLYDRCNDRLQLVSTIGLPSDFDRQLTHVDAGESTPCAAALRSAQRIVIEDLPAISDVGEFAQRLRAYGIRAAQSTPILDDGGAVAAIVTTYFDRPREPAERELRLLDLHVEVVRRQLQRKRAEEALAFMAQLSAAFAPIGSIEEIARTTCEKIREHFGASMVTFSHLNASGDEVVLFYSDQALEVKDGTHRLSAYLTDSGICELKQGRTLAICDVAADVRTALHAEAYEQWNVRSLVLAPHLGAGRRTFLLAVHKMTPYRWRTEDVELLEEIAERAHIRLDRAHAESALADNEAKLRENDRRKDEFLAMLAHELRNPLAPIVNAVHLLGQDTVDDALLRRAREIIGRQAARLTRLVDDLLEVSRITSGRIQLHMERIELSGIIDRAVETARPSIEQRRHEFELSCRAGSIWVDADAARLEQIVVNLLNNAAKYTHDGGRIKLQVGTDERHAVLRVVDNGIGIERDLVPRIFDLFTQAERSLDRSNGGLGIGLSLVQRLVSMHGGTIAVESTVGQGSEFAVRLPLARAPSVDRAVPPAVTRAPMTQPLRILIVDDNVDAAQSLGMLLETSGHVVRLAHDGAAALSAVGEHEPDVVFLDIGLPLLDGYEVAKRLRRNPGTRVATLVALTGYGQNSDREQARAAGFDHHLVKPVDPSVVEPILIAAARVLARERAQRA